MNNKYEAAFYDPQKSLLEDFLVVTKLWNNRALASLRKFVEEGSLSSEEYQTLENQVDPTYAYPNLLLLQEVKRLGGQTAVRAVADGAEADHQEKMREEKKELRKKVWKAFWRGFTNPFGALKL